MFVYVAASGGALAAENALTGNERRYDLSALPKVTFTDPAVSSVGLTENEARAQGIEPLVSKLPLEHVPRALAAHDTRGLHNFIAVKFSPLMRPAAPRHERSEKHTAELQSPC